MTIRTFDRFAGYVFVVPTFLGEVVSHLLSYLFNTFSFLDRELLESELLLRSLRKTAYKEGLYSMLVTLLNSQEEGTDD